MERSLHLWIRRISVMKTSIFTKKSIYIFNVSQSKFTYSIFTEIEILLNSQKGLDSQNNFEHKDQFWGMTILNFECYCKAKEIQKWVGPVQKPAKWVNRLE